MYVEPIYWLIIRIEEQKLVSLKLYYNCCSPAIPQSSPTSPCRTLSNSPTFLITLHSSKLSCQQSVDPVSLI